MARLPYVDPDGAPPDLARLFSDIAHLRGSVHNLHRELANQPAALRAFMGTSRYVRDDADLAPRLRELAVLATAYALDVPYERFHHVPAARRVGVTEEQLAAFPAWRAAPVFDRTERAVLDYADQVARTRSVDDAAFSALRDVLSPAEIVDLALTCGWYHLCAAILGPLQIETEGTERRPAMLFDTTTEFGQRVQRRLRDEEVIWLATVRADGTPEPRPVWFLWDGNRFLIYSRPNTPKLRHLQRDPHVALHFNTDSQGGDVVIFTGEAVVAPGDRPANQEADYLKKYREAIGRIGMTPESFARDYAVPIRVTPRKLRGD